MLNTHTYHTILSFWVFYIFALGISSQASSNPADLTHIVPPCLSTSPLTSSSTYTAFNHSSPLILTQSLSSYGFVILWASISALASLTVCPSSTISWILGNKSSGFPTSLSPSWGLYSRSKSLRRAGVPRAMYCRRSMRILYSRKRALVEAGIQDWLLKVMKKGVELM